MGVLKAVLYTQSASSSFRDQSLLLKLTVFSRIFFISRLEISACPLRMVSQAYNVFDTISAHEFVKHLIFKVASSITDYSSGCPKSAENISL